MPPGLLSLAKERRGVKRDAKKDDRSEKGPPETTEGPEGAAQGGAERA